MKQSKRLVKAVKEELRKQRKTYADLMPVLDLSHASVKRLFAENSFTLERLEKICEFLGIEFSDLIQSMEKQAEHIDQLTLEQEMEFARDTRLLCFAHAVLNKWQFEDIISIYDISEHEGIRFLARLDRMKLIEMLPENRYRLLISRDFSWIKSGPIQSFFEKELQADFFNSSFNRDNELRVFVSSMLSEQAIETVIKKMSKLAQEINDLHSEEEKLALDKKRGVSTMLAIRPWETLVFKKMRRARN